ncbi:MAG: sugar transferase [Acidimicrobiales bacterium]
MIRAARWAIQLACAAVVLGLAAFHALSHHYDLFGFPRFGWELVFIALLCVTTYAFGLPLERRDALAASGAALGAVIAAAVIVSVLALVLRQALLPRLVVFGAVAALTPVLSVISSLTSRSLSTDQPYDRALLVLSPPEEEVVRRDVAGHCERPVRVAAAITVAEVEPVADDPEPLVRLADEHRATVVVIGREAQVDDFVVAQAAELHARGIRVRTLTMFYDEWLGKLPIVELERVSLLFDINEVHFTAYARVKRLLDLAAAVLLMPVLLVLIPIVAVADLVGGNRGPLFYSQERVGKDGAIFRILKFRTMRPHDGPTTWTAENDPRIGMVGRLMRKTHVDEVPQVMNLLRRELSIVGPRPEQPRYVAELRKRIPFYDVRHLVRPGLTGWAQVKYDYGSTEADALEKLQYEFFYLRHQRLNLDLLIIGRTLRSIMGGK